MPMPPDRLTATIDEPLVRRRASHTPTAPTTAGTRPATRMGSRPAWLSRLDAIHRGHRSVATVAVEAAAMLGAAVAAGVPIGTAGILVAVVVTGLYVGNWYSERSCVETQGVFWSVKPLGLPIGLTTLA